MSSPERIAFARRRQFGAMLIELMIGLAIAALAIGAAMASLLVARDATSAVGELSQLQQQAAHAMRVMGLQIRPAGSLNLEPASGDEGLLRFVLAAPALEGHATVVHGEDASVGSSLSLAHLAPPLLPSQRHDCLGQAVPEGGRMDARFELDGKGSLRCKSSSGQTQPLVAGVHAFRVRYRVRSGDQVRNLVAADVTQARLWPSVTALEVCLDLRGDERSAAYEGNYIDCAGRPAPSGSRLHLVTRKLFHLRTREGG